MALGGHSWDRAGQIWYKALIDTDLLPLAQFVDFAKLTIKHAHELYRDDTSVAEVIANAWKDVRNLHQILGQTSISTQPIFSVIARRDHDFRSSLIRTYGLSFTINLLNAIRILYLGPICIQTC